MVSGCDYFPSSMCIKFELLYFHQKLPPWQSMHLKNSHWCSSCGNHLKFQINSIPYRKKLSWKKKLWNSVLQSHTNLVIFTCHSKHLPITTVLRDAMHYFQQCRLPGCKLLWPTLPLAKYFFFTNYSFPSY